MYRWMMALTLFPVLVTACWAQHGALAIDANHGSRWGTATGYPTQYSANERALAECGGGCRVVVMMQNACGAYAADQDNGSSIAGWATKNTQGLAESWAMWECRNRGGSRCRVRVWACSLSASSTPTHRPQRID